jgi:hypothetical protein
MITINDLLVEQRRKQIESLPQIEVKGKLKVHILHDGVKVLSGDVVGNIRPIMIIGSFDVINLTTKPVDFMEYTCDALFYDSDGINFTDLVETKVICNALEFNDNVTVKASFQSFGRWIKLE